MQKIANDGRSPENIKRVLEELDYIPVVNKYIAEHELSLSRYLDDLVNSGFIKTVEYDDYIKDETDKLIYTDHFEKIYNELWEFLMIQGGPKQMPELTLPKGEDIFSSHKSGSSMGDVHMVLMAAYLRLPIILLQDSDIPLLRDITKRRLSMSSYQLQIFDAVDVIKQIAQNGNGSFVRKELKQLTKMIGESGKWEEIAQVWDDNHQDKK